jgi:uncharacterized membrane protein
MTTTTTADDLVGQYLHRLEAVSAGLPADERAELLQQISDHITSARADAGAEGGHDGPALVRTVLERLGSPEEVAAAAGAEVGGPVPAQATAGTGREVAAVLLLGAGWIFGGLGWLVGLVLAWTSGTWRTRDKVLATVLPLPVLLALLISHMVSAAGHAATVAVVLPLVLVGVAGTAYLGFRLVRRARTLQEGGPTPART